MSDDKLVERIARQADPDAWRLLDEGRQAIALYARIEQSRKTASAAIAALQSERASMEGEIERLREALEAILALDGPYCDNCHSEEIGQAFRLARAALNPTGAPE